MKALLGLNPFKPAAQSVDMPPILDSHNQPRLLRKKNKKPGVVKKKKGDLRSGCDFPLTHITFTNIKSN